MRVLYQDKVWGKDEIQALIDTNDTAVARALLVVYANQTADERADGQTKHLNGVGFSGRDAEWLSDIARKWQRYGRWASRKQLNAVRKAMRRYWRQMLMEMVQNKGAVEIKGRLKQESEDEALMEGTW